MPVLITDEFVKQFAVDTWGAVFFHGNFSDAVLNKLSVAFTKLCCFFLP